MNGRQKIWKQLRDHGDVSAIHEETGLSRTTILKALDEEDGSEEIMEKVNGYFRDKIKSNIRYHKNKITEAQQFHNRQIRELQKLDDSLS